MSTKYKDNGGTIEYLHNIDLMTNVNWFDIIRQNAGKQIDMCTYGRPDAPRMHSVADMIYPGKLIVGTISHYPHWDIEDKPNVKVRHDTHAKLLFIAPDEVYISSQNVEFEDWYQTTVHIKDRSAYEHYHAIFDKVYESDDQFTPKPFGKTDIVTTEDKINYAFQNLSNNIITGTLNPNAPIKHIDVCKCKLSMDTGWKTKLHVNNTNIIIVTQTLPNEKYVKETFDLVLNKYPNNKITLIANADPNFLKKLAELYYPKATIYGCNNIHSKMILHSGNNVWLSSHNFGKSGIDRFETTIQLRGEEIYKFYYDRLTEFIGFAL